MPEYVWICENMPKSAFVLHFPIVIPCLVEHAVSYSNVCTKLEAIV